MKLRSPLSMEIDHERRWTRSLEIAQLYNQGLPVERIARMFNVSRGTVLRAARLLNLPKRPKKKVDEVTRVLIADAYGRGDSLAEIAGRYSVSQALVSLLGSAKYPARHRCPRKKTEDVARPRD